MCPDRNALQPKSGQLGLGLPVAMFVIVVLGFLVLAMAELQEAGRQSFTYQILSARAFQAAESGAQMAVHRLVPPTGASAPCNNTIFNHTFSNTTQGLSGCSANVTCTEVPVTVGATTETYYYLSATGSCGSGIEEASRVIEVRIRQ